MLSLRIDPGFDDDLSHAIAWYSEHRDAEKAAALESEVRAGLLAIKDHPRRHHFDITGFRRLNLRKFPYCILYDETLIEVLVFALRHNSQKPTHGTRRLQS
ncbi:type II toxin-antitoxin system RelE/ParE family toxin [Roseibacillus persicicus]|uniref:type II toxin-antitoxin system RelE/ParE family toxin n=1 Tax=Roseibacillus persicicus TaxID=454148 RepID=UPI00281007A8|nr:type II toxin-antitoxin system RelE/ParE family toxin [Roseibacillus persicicus]MDQ8191600.1 type II toxin-antitoxin system RelE/ParE family toxin [Roseibacillus persicicus]